MFVILSREPGRGGVQGLAAAAPHLAGGPKLRGSEHDWWQTRKLQHAEESLSLMTVLIIQFCDQVLFSRCWQILHDDDSEENPRAFAEISSFVV